MPPRYRLSLALMAVLLAPTIGAPQVLRRRLDDALASRVESALTAHAIATGIAEASPQEVRDSLRHPPGYVPAEPGTLGRVTEIGRATDPALVLIPGLGWGASVFEDLARRNADRFRSLAVTLPGYEGTAALPMPAEGTSYGEQTWTRSAEAAIAELIRTRKLTKPILIGHFIHGGQLALRLALHHPELVGGAVVVAGELARAMPSRKQPGQATLEERIQSVDRYRAQQWFKTVSKETWDANTQKPEQLSRHEERARTLHAQKAAVPLPVMIRYFCEFLASDLSRDLGKLKVPVLAIVPDFSPELLLSFPNLQVQQRDSWKGADTLSPLIHLREILNTRIFVMDDEAQAFDEVLAAFVRQARR